MSWSKGWGDAKSIAGVATVPRKSDVLDGEPASSTTDGEQTGMLLRMSVAVLGEVPLTSDDLVALDAVMDGSVALDLSSTGRWRVRLRLNESRRWSLGRARISWVNEVISSSQFVRQV
jgi:hypothetical protein